jgi:hypothetical protein
MGFLSTLGDRFAHEVADRLFPPAQTIAEQALPALLEVIEKAGAKVLGDSTGVAGQAPLAASGALGTIAEMRLEALWHEAHLVKEKLGCIAQETADLKSVFIALTDRVDALEGKRSRPAKV